VREERSGADQEKALKAENIDSPRFFCLPAKRGDFRRQEGLFVTHKTD